MAALLAARRPRHRSCDPQPGRRPDRRHGRVLLPRGDRKRGADPRRSHHPAGDRPDRRLGAHRPPRTCPSGADRGVRRGDAADQDQHRRSGPAGDLPRDRRVVARPRPPSRRPDRVRRAGGPDAGGRGQSRPLGQLGREPSGSHRARGPGDRCRGAAPSAGRDANRGGGGAGLGMVPRRRGADPDRAHGDHPRARDHAR